MGFALPGKVLLGILLVTASTGGFTLGYFVGKSVSPSSASFSARQPLSGGEAASQAPVAVPGPPGGEPSAPVSVAQSPPSEDRQSGIALPGLEKSPLKTGTSSGSEGKKPSGEKGLPGQAAGSQGAGQGDQATTKSLPSGGSREVSGSADSSAGKVVYTVQAGAFRNQKDAEALKRKLEARKYKASIRKEADAKGVAFFKVRTGEFDTKKEASVFALKLRKAEGLNAFAMARK